MIPSALNWYNTGVTVTLGELIESGVDIWKGCTHQYPHCEINGVTGFTIIDRLREKIVAHYWFRQIGQETPARFIHYLHARMNEIMPYYCQLYEFEQTFHSVEDKLESYHLTETLDKQTTGAGTVTGTVSGSSEGTSTGTDTTNANNTKKFSNTPQGSIDNLDDHLTEATIENGTASDTSTSTASSSSEQASEQASEETGTETYTLVRRGNIGVQPLGTEVKDIRSAFINIDMMIIKELEDLFLKVY